MVLPAEQFYETLPNPINLPSAKYQRIRNIEPRKEIIQAAVGTRETLTDTTLTDKLGELFNKIDEHGSIYTMDKTKQRLVAELGFSPDSLMQSKRNGVMIDSLQNALQEQINKFASAAN